MFLATMMAGSPREGSGSETAARPIRVFLCDDVEEFRALMRFALEEDPSLEVVGEASDGGSCIDCVREHRPDVLLLDLSMPHRDGLEVIDDVCSAVPDTAIVVLSGFSASRLVDQVLGAGAVAFLEKSVSFEEIRSAVRAAAQR